MSKIYLGIDIGGTAVKLGLVDETGTVLDRAERSVSFDGYRTPILDTVQAAAADFTAGRRETLCGIGVSATGQIDSRRGIVAGTCGSLPGWVGAPIRDRLEADYHLPVTVANDANCMCLGEVWAGAARGCTDVIGITIGTGWQCPDFCAGRGSAADSVRCRQSWASPFRGGAPNRDRLPCLQGSLPPDYSVWISASALSIIVWAAVTTASSPSARPGSGGRTPPSSKPYMRRRISFCTAYRLPWASHIL